MNLLSIWNIFQLNLHWVSCVHPNKFDEMGNGWNCLHSDTVSIPGLTQGIFRTNNWHLFVMTVSLKPNPVDFCIRFKQEL